MVLPQLILPESNFHYSFSFVCFVSYSHFSLHMHTIAHSSCEWPISMNENSSMHQFFYFDVRWGSMLLLFLHHLYLLLNFVGWFCFFCNTIFHAQYMFGDATLGKFNFIFSDAVAVVVVVAIFRLFNTIFNETSG